MRQLSWGLLKRYGIAVLAVGLALAASQAVDPVLKPTGYLLCFAAVWASLRYGGPGPGVAATGLAAAANALVLVQGLSSGRADLGDAESLILFILVAVLFDLRAWREHRTSGQQAHFSAVVASSEDAIIGRTLDGIITSWNAGAERLYGYRAAEVIGQPISLLVPPDRTDELKEILARLRRGERFTHTETLRVRKDGTPVTVSLSVSPVKDAAGHVVGASAIARDITDRVLAREQAAQLTAQLCRRVQELETMLQVIPAGISIAEDPACRHTYANAAMTGLLGLPSETEGSPEASGMARPAYRVLRNGRELAPSELPLQVAAASGMAVHETELDIIRDDGSVINVIGSAAPLHDEHGAPRGAISAFLDITDRVQAEQAREWLLAKTRAERLRLQTVIDQLPVPVVIANDPAGISGQWNQAANRLWDQPLKLPLLSAADQEQVRQADGRQTAGHDLPLARALRGETVRGAEFALLRLDGSQRAILVDAAPILDEAGQITGGVVVSQDITERKSLEQLKDAFMTLAAHELRTPVTAIKAAAQLLQREMQREGIPLAEREVRLLRTLDERASYLAGLVNELLDVSHIEAGQIALTPETTDLGVLLRQAVTQQQVFHPTYAFSYLAPDRPAIGYWDRGRIGQVLANLLDNAVKYSPRGSPITARLTVDHQTAHVTIEDRGMGIPPADLPRVFERHYRAGNTAQAPSGLGLGLYLSDQIVRRHKGRIWAESIAQQGTTFHLVLPLVEPSGEW